MSLVVSMKIALCLSGQARFHWKLKISQYFTHADDFCVFFHTWNDNWIHTKEQLLDYSRPTDYIIEDFDYKYYRTLTKQFDDNFRENCIPMYYSINQSIGLALKSDIKFDIIIRSRWDLDIGQLVPFIKNNSINIPRLGDWRGYCDQFAYGPIEYMKYYSETYNSIIAAKNLGNSAVFSLDPESVLRQHLNKRLDISINRFDMVASLRR